MIEMRLHCAHVEVHLARAEGGSGNFIGDPNADGTGITLEIGVGDLESSGKQAIVLMHEGRPYAIVDGVAALDAMNHLTVFAGIASCMAQDPVARERARRENAGEKGAKASDVHAAATDFVAAAIARAGEKR